MATMVTRTLPVLLQLKKNSCKPVTLPRPFIVYFDCAQRMELGCSEVLLVYVNKPFDAVYRNTRQS